MKRRQALALTSMLAASAALPPLASAAPAVVSGKSSFIPRRGKGPRIVICAFAQEDVDAYEDALTTAVSG